MIERLAQTHLPVNGGVGIQTQSVRLTEGFAHSECLPVFELLNHTSPAPVVFFLKKQCESQDVSYLGGGKLLGIGFSDIQNPKGDLALSPEEVTQQTRWLSWAGTAEEEVVWKIRSKCD